MMTLAFLRRSLEYFLGSLLLACALSAAALAPVQPAGPSLCYAFNREGNIILTCQGKTERITQSGDIGSFAIDTTGSWIAFVRNPFGRATLKLISLHAPFNARIVRQAMGALTSSCGTILFLKAPISGTQEDLITSEPPIFDSQVEALCSADRSVVLGWKHPHTLLLKKPGSSFAAVSEDVVLHQYGVSPNGRYLAYGKLDEICRTKIDGATHCVASSPVAFERFSVTDDGDVLFTANSETGQGCFFKSQWHQSPRPKPGFKTEDSCTEIVLWRPGMKSPEPLQPYGLDAQWLSPQAAEALRRWKLAIPKAK